MASDDLLTREEVLSGLPARRAQTLLFLIESRTAALVAQSHEVLERFLTEAARQERNLAFLEAFALGREPPVRPTIQDLERFAAQWADLAPQAPRLRAAIAHLVGQKYRVARQNTPGLRAALGLDDEAVRRAFQQQFGKPLDSIYAPRLPPIDRLRWAWAGLARRLDALPPFWTAFALTLTETVGAGILALPIALAAIGPLAGVALLVVLGVVNQLTIAAVAESVARSGAVRFGNAFFGRLVADYLGGAGSLMLSVSLAILCLAALMACYIGAGTILGDATRVPAGLWVALLFVVALYALSRRSLTSTIASALVIGAINIVIIVTISLLGLTHLQLSNLAYVNVPLLGGRPFDPSLLRLIFGVVLLAYFGHMSVGSCASVVLQRDPSGRSLILGSIAAQLAAMLLYCLWVVAINGALAPSALVGLSGTALAPLVAEVGPSVQVLGSLFAILAMGMVSIQCSMGLTNLTREWLPGRSRVVVLLPRREGRLLLAPRGRSRDDGPRLALTYLGLENGQPRVRLSTQMGADIHHVEMGVERRWDLAATLERTPELRDRGLHLVLEVLEASRGSLRLGVTSSMSLTYEGGWDALGLRLAEGLATPDAEQQLVNWLIRQQRDVALADVTAHTGQDERLVRTRLTTLVERGYVGEVDVGGELRYRARLARRHGRGLPDEIWRALEEPKLSPPAGDAPRPGVRTRARRLREWLLGERGRFLLSVSPVCAVFLLSEWLLVSGTESFAAPLSFGGVITATLVGGLFPVLMLIAARRKGELVPALVVRFLGHPLLTAGIYLIFLANLFLHGLIIWSGPLERASALGVGVLAILATVATARRGAFTPRAVVELRDNQRQAPAAVFGVTIKGEPVAADVRLRYADEEQRCQAAVGVVPMLSSLRQASFQLPPSRARELKVWVHRIGRDGESPHLPASVEVSCEGEPTPSCFDLAAAGEQIVVPIAGGVCSVQINLAATSAG